MEIIVRDNEKSEQHEEEDCKDTVEGEEERGVEG